MTNVIDTITWLLFDSGMRRNEISKQTGISSSTIYRVTNGHQSVGQLSTSNALKLFELAETVQKETA